jgi:hypothetical protein
LKDGRNEIRIRLADGPLNDAFFVDLMYVDIGLFTGK